MVKFLMVGALISVLAGCATSTPLGGNNHVIECNGAMQPVAACFKKAAQVCPRGFDLAPLEHSGGMLGGVVDQGGGFGTALSSVHKSIIVSCRV